MDTLVEIVGRCFPSDEDASTRVGHPETIQGRALWVVEERSQGTGIRAGYDDTTWIVDAATCRRVGLTRTGSLGSYREEARLVGSVPPTTGERAWLLARAGFVAWDVSRPEHAVATWVGDSPVEGLARRVDGTQVMVTRAPPLEWHAGAIPSFTVAWRPAADRWVVVHADALAESRSERFGGLVLHTLQTRARAPSGVEIVEDAVGRRWAFVGDAARAQPVDGGVPAALSPWHWTARSGGLDPGIHAIVVTDRVTGARWTVDLGGVAGVAWVPVGLRVEPFEGEGTAEVIPAAALRRALVE